MPTSDTGVAQYEPFLFKLDHRSEEAIIKPSPPTSHIDQQLHESVEKYWEESRKSSTAKEGIEYGGRVRVG
jgi:hypothetical protein